MKRFLMILVCMLACTAIASAVSAHTASSAARELPPIELEDRQISEPLLGASGAVQQCTLTLTFPDLQPSYPINDSALEDGTLEYNWEVVLRNGNSYLSVGSRHTKISGNTGYEQMTSMTPEEMDTFLFLWMENAAQWQFITTPSVTVTGNTFAWKFLVPESFTFDDNTEIDGIYITIGNEDWHGNVDYNWTAADYTNGTGVTSLEVWFWPGEELQASYPVNLPNLAVNDTEYDWSVSFTNGTADLVVSSFYRHKNAPQTNLAIADMPHDVYVGTKEHGWQWIGSPAIEIRGNAIVWTLPIPDIYGLTADNLKFSDAYICTGGKEDTGDLHWSVRWFFSPAIDAAYPGSGQCGDDLFWSLSTDGILTITGSGDMWNYTDDNPAPWNYGQKGIREINLPEGLTYIGSLAFANCKSIARIQIPVSVKEIGAGAFFACFLLRDVLIPSTVEYIGKDAFLFCNLLETIDYCGTQTSWAAISADERSEALAKASIRFVRRGDVNYDSAVSGKDITVLRRCFAGGYGITVDPYVADANKDTAVNGKDITLLRRYLAGGYNISLE